MLSPTPAPKSDAQPPPETVAIVAPARTLLPRSPRMTFGNPNAGSNRPTRWPFTLTSSAWSSVVPRKFVAGFVPAFPVSAQPFGPGGPVGPIGPVGPAGP